jgi:transcriptional regulator with XRE-family HTH domain
MLLKLKMTLLRKEVRQTRMALDLGWDPAKLSRIIHQTLEPTPQDRNAIAEYLKLPESRLFPSYKGRQINVDHLKAERGLNRCNPL